MAYRSRNDIDPYYATADYPDPQQFHTQQAPPQRQYSHGDAGVSMPSVSPRAPERQYSNNASQPSYPTHDNYAAPQQHADLVSAMGYQAHHDTTSTLHDDYPPEEPQWDSRSAKSYGSHYAGSQVHLNPQYEMSQVPPPVPNQGVLPYAHQQNYPPGPRPDGPYREGSSGYSTTREKMMRRRSVKKVELQQGNLVLDVQVPTHIVPQGRVEEEMTKMRYTGQSMH